MTDTLPVPASSAAPARFSGREGAELASMAAAVAEQLEGTRRSVTLGGSLMLIPASVMAMVAAGGLVGAGPAILALFAMVGLASGPAACFAALAVSNVLGTPIVRRVFLRRAAAMGLSPAEAARAWRDASDRLDAAARERLLRPERATS